MKNNVKNIVVTIVFITIILGFTLLNIIMPDADISESERRRLSKAPTYSSKKLFSGKIFEELEGYFLDQFVFRESFRGLKAFVRLYLFQQKDNNDIYIVDGNILKMEYPLNEKAVLNAADKINEVYNKYLEGMNVSYAIIPDKNYFVASQNGYLYMDYDKLPEIMNNNIQNIKYIDLFDSLSIKDYYKTDIHWRQDKITDIADLLLKEMGNERLESNIQYTKKALYPFYGSYYGQAALNLKPDSMVYLTNYMIENATVFDHIDKTYSKVYVTDNFETIDSYNFFLSGAKSVISVTNPAYTGDKELILFRDSFGSSIAPLLMKGYSKITLVDLRYMGTDILGDYIDFSKDADVLFLYNTVIINNSYMLK